MKCEVARDLLTLYVEELCSPETAKELEVHLEECPKCREQLERYKKGIEEEKKLQKEQNTVENEEELNPFKKIRIKNIIKMLAIIFLTIFLAIVLCVIGALTYGQVTNESLSFSAIADAKEVKDICEDLTRGDVQALLDAVALDAENLYADNNEGVVARFDDYLGKLQADMEEAYAYHFKGKEVRVEIEGIEQEAYDLMWSATYPYTYILVGFYVDDEQIYEMTFGKIAAKKYVVMESAVESQPGFVARVLPYDDISIEICLNYALQRQYKKLLNGEEVGRIGAGLGLCIKKEGTLEQQEDYEKELIRRATALHDAGWYMKESMFSVHSYDETVQKWVYKVWFLWEEQEDKDTAIVEYKFHYDDNNLYVMDGQEPVIFSGDDAFPEEVKQQLLSLFE